MKITTKKITSGWYSVFSNGVYYGTITKLDSELRKKIEFYGDDEADYGQWASFDRNDNWLGSTYTKKYGLKWCFGDYR